MQVSFGGTYIKPITIKKLATNGEFVPHDVSLVQFDTKSQADINAIEQTFEDWKIFDNCYMEIIRDVAVWIHNLKRPQKTRKIFFLTNQQSDYQNLNPDAILGQYLVYSRKNSKSIELEVLQANPFHNHDVEEFRRFSRIGTGMLDEIKAQYPNKRIKIRADEEAVGFYEKNGFVPDAPGSLDYTYTPN